ncbi:thioredoxin [Candidatus Falkowbacteria bacterium]|jgi:thioredoxin 1|nr:thioredoxin [Candidatus Falkowbacteria bacterium]MBT4432888.1 thioredoxin [Candidatus Falkowbacteria bacterium]
MANIFTNDNFQEDVIEASKEKPVLVDFFADWCGPCQVMAPVIDELSETMGDKASVGKLNVDQAQEIAGKYGVMSIPTVKIFRNGEVVDETVGAQSADNLKALLEKHI